MSEFKWYVIRVISGQEKKIKTYLEKEIEASGVGESFGEIINPVQKIYQVRRSKNGKSKKVAVERSFFPGYMIVKADLNNGELVHIIKNINGVVGFLSSGENKANQKPVPMRDAEINRILGKMDDTGTASVEEDIIYSIGENIRVMDGPFNGFTGTVEKVLKDKKKLNVTVKIFGRNTPVELNFSQVAKQE